MHTWYTFAEKVKIQPPVKLSLGVTAQHVCPTQVVVNEVSEPGLLRLGRFVVLVLAGKVLLLHVLQHLEMSQL